MPLICPDCKQTKAYTAIGIYGKLQCFECKTLVNVNENFVEDEK